MRHDMNRNKPQWNDDQENSLFMHVPAEHERTTGTEDYAAHKMVWVPRTTPQFHQGWLKHVTGQAMLTN